MDDARVIDMLTAQNALLERQISLLEQIAQRVGGAPARRPLSQADRAMLGAVLPTIWAVWKDRFFAVADLRTDPGLRASVEQLLGGNLDQRAKAFGKALRRSVGQDINGLFVEAGAALREGQLWRISSRES